MTRTLTFVLAACFSLSTFAQGNRVDVIRHDAPDLANSGQYEIGVRMLELTGPGRPDILNTLERSNTTFYDRSLTVWMSSMISSIEARQRDSTYPASRQCARRHFGSTDRIAANSRQQFADVD